MKAGNLVGVGLGLCAFAVNLVLGQYSYCGAPSASCPVAAYDDPMFNPTCTTANVICPSSSSSYLQCLSSQWVLVSCLSGATFDCTSKQCTKGGSGGGNGTTSTTTFAPTTPGGGAGGINCANDPDGVFPDYDNCRNYYVCMNGVPYSVSCPTDYYYNPINEACSKLIPTTCKIVGRNVGGVVCPAEAIVTVADPNDCNKYVICTRGVGVFYACGPGLYYSIENNQCVWTIPARCR